MPKAGVTPADMPEGAHRDLRDLLQQLYREAGMPTLREIEKASEEALAQGRSSTTVSRDTINRMLRGESTLPRWESVEVLASLLGGDPTRCRLLWKAAAEAPLPTMPLPEVRHEEPVEVPELPPRSLADERTAPSHSVFMHRVVLKEELRREFGGLFDADYADALLTEHGFKRAADLMESDLSEQAQPNQPHESEMSYLRRRLIAGVAETLEWSASDPFVVETPRARLISGLLDFAEQRRRGQLRRLEQLARQGPDKARSYLDALAGGSDRVAAVIIAALGSRNAATAANLYMQYVHGYPTTALRQLVVLLDQRGTGPRAIMRHLVTNAYSDLSAVLMLAETGEPGTRDKLLRLLPPRS